MTEASVDNLYILKPKRAFVWSLPIISLVAWIAVIVAAPTYYEWWHNSSWPLSPTSERELFFLLVAGYGIMLFVAISFTTMLFFYPAYVIEFTPSVIRFRHAWKPRPLEYAVSDLVAVSLDRSIEDEDSSEFIKVEFQFATGSRSFYFGSLRPYPLETYQPVVDIVRKVYRIEVVET